MSFEAKYHGRCAACEERIIPGDHVRYSDGDEIIHNRCEESAQNERPVEVCGTCWLTKPCDCEE
jgi:hypothetical protein